MFLLHCVDVTIVYLLCVAADGENIIVGGIDKDMRQKKITF